MPSRTTKPKIPLKTLMISILLSSIYFNGFSAHCSRLTSYLSLPNVMKKKLCTGQKIKASHELHEWTRIAMPKACYSWPFEVFVAQIHRLLRSERRSESIVRVRKKRIVKFLKHHYLYSKLLIIIIPILGQFWIKKYAIFSRWDYRRKWLRKNIIY